MPAGAHGGIQLRGSYINPQKQGSLICRSNLDSANENISNQLPAGRGHLLPLKQKDFVMKMKNAGGRMASISQSIAKPPNNEEKLLELFQRVSLAENERMNEEEAKERRKKIQADREEQETESWRNFHKKLRGELRGTYLDPHPGENIPYSKFWKLLNEGKVEYVEYADYGEHISVILPHNVEPAANAQAGETPVVYKRHRVEKMPADAMGDVWKLLHPQLKHIRVVRTETILHHLYRPAKIFTVWGLRVALAFAVYKFLEKNLSYFCRFRDPADRGWSAGQDLSAGDYLLGALGESRARFLSAEEKTGVTFDDFAGQEYIKREVQEIVKLLKESKDDPSIVVPKGVLLHGPPGTGKTLLARAIAGEAGLPFFSASGAEFVEMFSGVAAARVKDLFTRARVFAPSIIFIDEIDAIGAKRGSYDVGGGGVEREQGLIQMLTELDGFQTGLVSSKVLVIGATNRIDMLDPALLRKGRFDKIMAVGLPSEEGRLAILQVHAKNKPFESEEKKLSLLRSITKSTNRFSGAELANILNEAVILAIREDQEFIEKKQLEEAISRAGGTFATGQEDVLDRTGEARTRLAYREAGVAVLDCYYPNPHTPFVKTNITRLDSTINMQYEDPPEFVYRHKHEIVEEAIRKCAPRIVEELIFGKDNTSWVSASFLSDAGVLFDRLILQSGFTALGNTYYKQQKDILAHLAPKIQALRDEFMRYSTQKCRSSLLEYRSALETLADRLMEKSELGAEEIWQIYKKSPRIPQPEVEPVDEFGALLYSGRWGVQGITLPGRISYHPGPVGFVTFGAPRPMMESDPVLREYLDLRAVKEREDFEKMVATEQGREAWEDHLRYLKDFEMIP